MTVEDINLLIIELISRNSTYKSVYHNLDRAINGSQGIESAYNNLCKQEVKVQKAIKKYGKEQFEAGKSEAYKDILLLKRENTISYKNGFHEGAKAQREHTFYDEIEIMSESANLRLYDKPEDLTLVTIEKKDE